MTPTVAAPTALVFRIFNEEPGSDFTGMVPAHFVSIASGEDGSTAACFKFLNELTLQSKSFSEISKSGRLSCVKYDKGQMESICIYDELVNKLSEKGVNKALLSPGGDVYSVKHTFSVHKLPEEAYHRMSRHCEATIQN